jgi:multidrug efflux system membrane fusion protein
MNGMNKFKFGAYVCLLTFFVLGSQSIRAQQQKSDAPEAVQLEAADRMTVTTSPLSQVMFNRMLRASAEVVSLNHSQISAQATGEVLKIEVETGDLVVKDAVLVRLDCRQSEYNQAVLNDAYALALKEFERSQSLQKKNAIAEQQLTQATSTLEQAGIRKQQVLLSVEHCLITAPFSGVVTERQVQLGAVAVPGSPILKLLQTDAVEVRVRLTSEELLSIWAAPEIKFISEGRAYPLSLRSALPVIDSVSNKRWVLLSIDGEAPFSGAPGDVVWQAEGQYLPVELIVERQGGLGYFIEEGRIARFIPLPSARLGHPARINPDNTEADDANVVVEGRFRIEEGSPIRAQEDAK